MVSVASQREGRRFGTRGALSVPRAQGAPDPRAYRPGTRAVPRIGGPLGVEGSRGGLGVAWGWLQGAALRGAQPSRRRSAWRRSAPRRPASRPASRARHVEALGVAARVGARRRARGIVIANNQGQGLHAPPQSIFSSSPFRV
jgi:hypothetical protein